jgi:PAS domain S-box-containing protein
VIPGFDVAVEVKADDLQTFLLAGFLLLLVVGAGVLISHQIAPSFLRLSRLSKAVLSYRFRVGSTESKQAEEALRQSEILNRTILNALPDLIICMHRDGTYLDIKSTAAFPTELPNLKIGENVANTLPPEAAEQCLTAVTEALKTRTMQIYEFPLTVQGHHLWQEARIGPLNADEVIIIVRDLTQRKQMEEALRQSEARLMMAQTVAQVGYWEFDLENQTRTWSEVSFHHWGFDPSQPEPSAAELLQRVHPDDRAVFQQHRDKTIGDGLPHALDIRVIHPNGSVRYLDSRAEPLFNAEGQVVKLIGTSVDITERKQTEKALQEREAMLRAIGDNLPKGFIYQRVYEPGKGFYYSYISAGVERLLGLKPEAVLEDPKIMRSIGFAEDLALADQVVQESLKNLSVIELQMRNRTATGEIQWSSIRSVPRRLEDGRTVWDGVEVDITELKRIEAALRASEELFRGAFDNAPIGISLVSPSGQFVKVNPCYCDLLGYSEAELLSLSFPQITHPADLDADLKGFEQVIHGERRSFQLEKRFLTKQGSLIPVLMNTALIRDPAGQPLYCVGHIQDIRHRLQVEQIKHEFISVVSHELRTPLTSIRGALGILGSGVFATRPQRAQQMLEIAISNSERLVRLVDDILTLERLESGKVGLEFEWCEAEELMKQALESVAAIAEAAGVELEREQRAVRLQAAPDAIVQTLTNLLSNAIKFSAVGGRVGLSVEVERGAVGGRVVFAVRDEGRGIPAEKVEVIFEQFQQVDGTDARKKGGTGLGLAICKSIVEQHGGQIWVESQLGRGSTFFFSLPLPQPEDEIS